MRRDWDVDPILCDFMLGEIRDVSERIVKVGSVAFHIPYLNSHKKYVLWTCHWPDCHNCCKRQGRLPLTSDDLISIGTGLKYKRTSEFIRRETLTVTYGEPTMLGDETIMTTINLKRKDDETKADDGTRMPCRFLDEKGGCTIHPARPGVCHMYPFYTWLQNEDGMARVHATYQFTGDCPGFYLADSIEPMKKELDEYAVIIYDYNMHSAQTMRKGFGAISMGV